jgi:AcrR family transcriptional regulator
VASETVDARRPTRRRRDRKAQLASVAADLFRRHGYHAVGIGDIAAAAGITGPAVYRHFASKQQILAHVLLSGVETLSEIAARHLDAPGSSRSRLSALTSAFARLAVERRDAVALWRWLGRHLDPDQRAEVRRHGDWLTTRWATELRQVRGELSPDDAELLCRAAMGVFGSPANYTVTLGKARHAGLLGELADAVLGCPLPPATAGGTAAGPATPQPGAAPRREVLLAQATRLFRERGYHAVTMEEIGAAAGIAGPSIYRHFASKSDLLRAAGNRMLDQLALDATRATTGSAAAPEVLDRLIVSYAGTVLAHRDLLAVYIAEMASLPEDECAELRRRQRAYLAEWVRLIAAVDPHREPADARVTAHAALTLANDLARARRLEARPALGSELTALMRAVTHQPRTSGKARPDGT